MTDYAELQKRCQRGCVALSNANNLLVECHAALGRLLGENERLSEAVKYSVEQFEWVSSADGSGHADIARAVLRIAGWPATKENPS